MPQNQYDAIVIGAGHNGLVTAGYLAKDGLSVLVLERLDRIGGACTTDEVFPRFSGPFCSYNCHALQGKVIDELKLREHGFDIIKPGRDISTGARFTPFIDGAYIGGPGAKGSIDVARQIGALCEHDGRAYLDWQDFWDQAAGILAPYILTEPPTLAELVDGVRGTANEPVLEKMITWGLTDLADYYFDDDRVKGAMMGSPECDPRHPGSVMSNAMLKAISRNAREQDQGIPRGSMSNITDAMATAAKSHGAVIRTGAPVADVLVENGETKGVRLANGEEIYAFMVVSNADPKRTFNSFFKPEEIGEATLEKVNRWKTQAGCVKFLASINGLPDYSAYFGEGYNADEVIYTAIRPTKDYVVQSWMDAAAGRPTSCPVMSIQITSLADPSLTPPGQHYLSNWVLYYPPKPAEGTWEDYRKEIGDKIISTISQFAPNFEDILIDYLVQTPADLEARVGLTDGNIRHLDMIPQQLLSQRQSYRTPVRNFYMCGAGTHPCGEVTGAPGHNAAHAILRDLERIAV